MSGDRFSYQKLRVYEDMIRSISFAEDIATRWDRVHAITDHFTRASEGVLVCLAEACRARSPAPRNEAVGHSMGSVLECAACFDVAVCKSLCPQGECREIKQKFCSVFRQLHGLRKSWQAKGGRQVREDHAEYGETYVFNHERLDAYQLALDVNRRIASLQLLDRLSRSDFRRIDQAATSIVLNIAEGNGRLSHLDHSRFIEIANRSNTKLAARIEMCAIRGAIGRDAAAELNRLLVRVDQMTAKLADAWRNQR